MNPRSTPRVSPAGWIAWWVLLMALWLWIDDTVAIPELVAGAVAAAIAATAAQLVLAQREVVTRVRLSWFRRIWRLAIGVPPDLLRLYRALLRQLLPGRRPRGRFRAVHFEAGALDDPYDTTRRALAKAAGSFAPNTIVVGIDAERDLLLVHQLEPADIAQSADPLELG